MSREEAIEVLSELKQTAYHDLTSVEMDALQYAIHFLESAEEVKQINK